MKTKDILRLGCFSSKYQKALCIVFLLSLPFLHATVNGDGIGYYAYVRSLLIDHNLQFSSDFQHPEIELEKIFLTDHFVNNPITKTGHLPNFYSVGPAILWSPFLLLTHLAVLGLAHLGWHIATDGHSWPYLVVMAGSTALYGFVGLLLSFALARKFVEERWAFWATIGIWFGSSVPLYFYVLPAWSHIHSIFATSLFLWYWQRTSGTRMGWQWLNLGLLSGLMIDVYLINGVFMLAVVYEVFLLVRQPGLRASRGRKRSPRFFVSICSMDLVHSSAFCQHSSRGKLYSEALSMWDRTRFALGIGLLRFFHWCCSPRATDSLYSLPF